MNKALFVMLDGTLITTKSGKSFPLHIEDWKFTNNFSELFKSAITNGYTIVILSEQLGIEEGVVNERNFNLKLTHICNIIEKDLGLKRNTILYNYCGDVKDEFRTLKYPGMLYEVAVDNNIVLSHSIMLGNTEEEKHLSSIGKLEQFYYLYQLPFIHL